MGTRYYETEHGDYPSVTTICGIWDKSAALMGWAANCAVDYIEDNATEDDVPVGYTVIKDNTFDEARTAFRNKSGEAMDIGTRVHDWCEAWLKGEVKLGDADADIKDPCRAFVEWANAKYSLEAGTWLACNPDEELTDILLRATLFESVSVKLNGQESGCLCPIVGHNALK